MQRYVSNELSHFVGRGLEKQADQYEILVKILKTGLLTHPPHNPNISGNLSVTDGIFSDNDMYSPQVVCFAIFQYQISLFIQKSTANLAFPLPKSF